MALKRAILVAATAFAAINIWTGAPLLALWVGSRLVGQTVLSMKAVVIVVLILAVSVFAMALMLNWLNNTYEELIQRPQSEQRASWLHSMSTESSSRIGPRAGLTAIERIIMISVYISVITLLIWFFFIAGSPLPH